MYKKYILSLMASVSLQYTIDHENRKPQLCIKLGLFYMQKYTVLLTSPQDELSFFFNLSIG